MSRNVNFNEKKTYFYTRELDKPNNLLLFLFMYETVKAYINVQPWAAAEYKLFVFIALQ